MKVNCVIVTYNRLALLKECLAAIEKQTYPIHKVRSEERRVGKEYRYH